MKKDIFTVTRRVFWLIAVLGVVLAFTACKPATKAPEEEAASAEEEAAPSEEEEEAAPSAEAEVTQEETLIIAIPGTPDGIDLDRQTGPQTWTMAAQVISVGREYARIPYPYDPPPVGDPTKVSDMTYPDLNLDNEEPGTLESCELSEDGLTATWHIRPGVVSPYGNELTSDDILWGVERSLDLGGIGAFFLQAANANDLSKWEAVDDYTVKITSDTPMAMACKINPHLHFAYSKNLDSTEAKKHATEDDPWATEWLSTHDASFGPYHITSWEAGNQVVMDLNPNYWRPEPAIKRIIWKVVAESANRVALLKAGKVDMAEDLGPEELVALDVDPSVNVAAVRGNFEFFIIYNHLEPPFDDVKVRQAINYAIPREQIARDIFKGLAMPWQGVIPSTYAGYVKYDTYTYNLDKARDLLEQAGYSEGFELPISYSSGKPVLEEVAILLKHNLEKIGVTVNLEKLPPAAAADLVLSSTCTFCLWMDAPFLPDINFAIMIWHKSDIASDWQNYENPEVDRMIAECNQVVDWQERLDCFKPVQDQIYEDASLAHIAEPLFAVALRSNLGGWAWDPALTYRVYPMEFVSE